jgi:5'-nucleotidase
MLAALWGMPALAMSQMFIGDAPMPWATAGWAAVKVFPLLATLRGRDPIVLNVNVPHLHDSAAVKGFRQTRLSSFFYGDVVDAELGPLDDEGRQRLALRFNRERLPPFAEDCDDGAVRAGYVSITPLTPMGAAHYDLGTALDDL